MNLFQNRYLVLVGGETNNENEVPKKVKSVEIIQNELS